MVVEPIDSEIPMTSPVGIEATAETRRRRRCSRAKAPTDGAAALMSRARRSAAD